MPVVNIPGVGPVNFPDTMSPEDMNSAAKRLHDEANVESAPSPIGSTLGIGTKALIEGGKFAASHIPGGLGAVAAGSAGA